VSRGPVAGDTLREIRGGGVLPVCGLVNHVGNLNRKGRVDSGLLLMRGEPRGCKTGTPPAKLQS
jgi:hypothetical protein